MEALKSARAGSRANGKRSRRAGVSALLGHQSRGVSRLAAVGKERSLTWTAIADAPHTFRCSLAVLWKLLRTGLGKIPNRSSHGSQIHQEYSRPAAKTQAGERRAVGRRSELRWDRTRRFEQRSPASRSTARRSRQRHALSQLPALKAGALPTRCCRDVVEGAGVFAANRCVSSGKSPGERPEPAWNAGYLVT
jgi:hypothetical protein